MSSIIQFDEAVTWKRGFLHHTLGAWLPPYRTLLTAPEVYIVPSTFALFGVNFIALVVRCVAFLNDLFRCYGDLGGGGIWTGLDSSIGRKWPVALAVHSKVCRHSVKSFRVWNVEISVKILFWWKMLHRPTMTCDLIISSEYHIIQWWSARLTGRYKHFVSAFSRETNVVMIFPSLYLILKNCSQ